MINPASIAFDIDGVVANTMALFIDIARNSFNINSIGYEDITTYYLEDCIDIDKSIITEIINLLIDGGYSETLRPMDDAKEVLGRLSSLNHTVLFVTARPHLGPIADWITGILQLEPTSIEIIAAGSFEAKTDILLDKNISHFVDDRFETCLLLDEAGINPILFRQPWNRKSHSFIEVGSWKEIESLIDFDGIKN